jgi:hypothetical protein
MANIKGYRIVKEIHTGDHLTVYLVEDSMYGGTAILRLTNQPAYRDAWNELYRNFDSKVKNQKYLPALKRLDILDDRAIAVMEGSEGNLLEAGQALTGRQIDQFVEAVVYLHHNQILLGKITRFNIWIREDGDITLYGAGERSVFNPESKSTIEDDIKHVLMIIKNHSSIPKYHFDGLSFESIGRLQEWVLSKLAIPKPGLVDTGVTSKTVFGDPDKKRQEPNESLPVSFSPLPKVEKKKNHSLSILLSGVAILLTVIFSITWLRSGPEQATKKVNEPKQTEVEDSAATEDKEEKKNHEQQNADESVNEMDVSQFAHLFSDWNIIKQSSINLAGSDYILVATTQKRDELSGAVKVSVLSHAQSTGWTKVWESPEYQSLLSEPDTYVKTFLTLTSNDGKVALLVFDLPDNGSLGISEIKALTVQANGSAEEVWSGFGYDIEKKDNEIHVIDMGLKKLSINNGSFTLQE